MRIAYFGGDMFYGCMELLIKSGHEIIALFADMPQEGEYDFAQNVLKQAELLNIPIIKSKPTSDDIKNLQQQKCDLVLTAGYAHKIPPIDERHIPYAINIHPSLLPEGGGAMPLPLVIVKGLEKTGVTLHKLSPIWDGGDIILQKSFTLHGTENLEDLLCESQNLAITLLKHFLEFPKECWNDSCPQTHQEGGYWAKPTAEEMAVNYTQDLETINRHLRAHRFVNSEGEIESVSNISAFKQVHNFEPGSILFKKDNVFLTATKDGFVCYRFDLKPSPEYKMFSGKCLRDMKI